MIKLPKSAPSYIAGLCESKIWIEQKSDVIGHATDGLIDSTDTEQHTRGTPFKRYAVDPIYGTGYRDFLSFSEGLQVVYGDFMFFEEHADLITGSDVLKFHFKLSGSNMLLFSPGTEYFIDGRKAVIALHPGGMVKKDCFSAGSTERSLTLLCSPEFITGMLQIYPGQCPLPLERFLSGGGSDFYYREMELAGRMTQCIFDLVNHSYCQALRHMHTQARLLDLLCMTFDGLIKAPPQAMEVHLDRRDREVLHQTKNLLSSHCGAPPSIEQLAKDMGVNRTKLMSGFKSLFGETVFQYQHRHRMEEARKLLLKEAGSVNQIAEIIGYSHQSTFSSAFKSYYNCSPKEMKNRK